MLVVFKANLQSGSLIQQLLFDGRAQASLLVGGPVYGQIIPILTVQSLGFSLFKFHRRKVCS